MYKNIEFLLGKPIAHRGFYNNIDIPENSLKAFEKAAKNNYIIELDVHLTRDNNVVVVHDDNLKRLTGTNEKVINLTLSEIKKLKILDTNECIPTLDEVLRVVDGKVPIIIELKYDRKAGKLEPFLAEILDTYNGKFVVKSFDPFIVRWFKKNRPNYIRGLLIGKKYKKFRNQLISKNIFVWISKPNFISCEYSLVNNKKFKKLNNKYFSLAWTIKNKEAYDDVKIVFDNLICENLDKFVTGDGGH